MNKISIRFFNDREVRAVWDDAAAKWWFPVLDVVGALNGESDYAKTRNYWKYLKGKLRKEGSQLVSATNQLKLVAPDGKRRLTDALDSEGVIALAKSFPNARAMPFLDWFVYSDNTILKYLEVYINAISLAPYVTGTAQPKMNQEKMHSIVVPLPPLAEQKRIVTEVERLLAMGEHLKVAS